MNRISTSAGPTLTARLARPDADQVLVLLQDMADAMKDAVALWDEDLKLVLHNARFREVVLPKGFRSLARGEDGVALAQELFETGSYLLPEGIGPADQAHHMAALVRQDALDLEMERANGVVLGAQSQRTALGGYLLTVFDKTDTKRAEQSEARKLEAVNDAVEALEEGFALWDADMNFMFCNDRYMEIVFPPDFPKIAPGTNALDVVPKFFEGDRLFVPEGVPIEALVQQVVQWITSFGEARDFHFKDGRVMRAAPHRTKLGGYLITTMDVTVERNAEAKRLEAVHDAVGALDEGFALLDQDLNVLLYNPRFTDLIYPNGHLPPDPGTPAREVMRQAYEAGDLVLGSQTCEAFVEETLTWVRELLPPREYRLRDGRIARTRVTQTALGGYLVLISDITEERNSSAKAREMVFDAMESLEEGFSLWDSDLRFLTCNQKHMDIVLPHRDEPFGVGTPAEETIREAFRSGAFLVPEGQCEEDYIQEVAAWAVQEGVQKEFHYKDGRTVIMTPHRTALGGLLLTALDVTEARNSEAKALGMLSDAMEALEEGFGLWDSEMRFVMCNQKYVDMIIPFRGRPFEVGTTLADGVREVIRAGLIDFPEGVSEDDLVADVEHWIQTFGEPREYHYKDGQVFVVSVKPTKLGAFLITVVDVTEERNSEAKARDMLLDAFQSLDEGLVLCDEHMNYVFGNDAWKAMNFVGHEDLIPTPGDSVLENFVALVQRGYYAIPDHMSQDDYIAWVMGEMSQHGKQVPYSVADGRHFIGSSHATAFGGSLLFVRDVTKQGVLEAELAQQRETAHQNEKLSALGELLAGVAHELNNPLSVVFGYSQMLQGKVEDPVVAERIDLICQSAERAAKIVKTFLAMARQRPTKIEILSINDIAATALEVSSYSLKSNGTEVLTHFDPDTPPIRGDFDQLAQVFSNLIINAGHAVEPQREAGQIIVKSFFDAAAGETVVEIRDNGPGIPKDIQTRIFEPFFTTKDVGEGTGVGLAFSHRIVSSHEGKLDLVSAPGKGTRFFVRMKAVEGDTAPNGVPDPSIPNFDTRHVLVVDDEEGVAQLIEDLLTEVGFAVTKTTSPRDALHLAEAGSFDLVLSDFKMPDMDGQAFFEAMQVVAPQMADRIGFITGDAMSANVSAFFKRSGRPHIEKPIVTSELMALLAQIGSDAGDAT